MLLFTTACSKQTMRLAETDHVICFSQSHGLFTTKYKFSFTMSKHLIAQLVYMYVQVSVLYSMQCIVCSVQYAVYTYCIGHILIYIYLNRSRGLTSSSYIWPWQVRIVLMEYRLCVICMIEIMVNYSQLSVEVYKYYTP